MNIEHLSLINSSMLVVLLLVTSFVVDKRSSPQQAFKVGAVLMLIAAIPLFTLLGSEVFIWQALAVLGVSALGAIILGNLAALLWQQASTRRRVWGSVITLHCRFLEG
ncbi:hypothetical protein QWZ16_23845 [Vibrio ostreicida]|uniref:Holin n=1 Tax=Vibrio ostreicida TaxID=526588 RepID=A0ABT8BZP2_9VIBR|nr:hypothetical protein [Vibrio ostreicida]MDN3612630.1 hypothetical protein [Vibrio ostreicida]